MKKILFLAGILFCVYSCKITEKIPIVDKVVSSRTYNLPDSLTYQVIEIINPIIYNMLDSILELSKVCLFNIHEQPYRYTFYSAPKEDTIFFFLCAEQYDENFYDAIYETYPEHWGRYYKYCFTYNGVWFTGNVYPDDNESDYFSDYYMLTNKEKKLNIYFPTKELYYCKAEHYIFYPSYFTDYTNIRYGIYNNAIVDIDVRPCENVDVIYHTMERKETLKTIAEKYCTTEKRIRELNHQLPFEGNLPAGKRIRVQ